MPIFIFLLIFLIVPPHGAYYLIVPFYYIRQPNDIAYHCSYNDRVYRNYRIMIRKIRKDYSYIPRCNLLVEETGTLYGNIFNNTQGSGIFAKADSDEQLKTFVLPPDEIPIEITKFRGIRYFTCRGSSFCTFKEAEKYVSDMHKYSKFKSQHLNLGQHPDAKRIWTRVWRHCFYDCFAHHDYYDLRQGLLKELNLIRLSLNLHELRFSDPLEEYARKRAILNTGKERLNAIYDRPNSYKELTASISPPFASLQMNKWFNQYFATKSQKKSHKIYIRRLHLLFSKIPKKVGFGAAIKEKYLFIVCEFE